MYIRVTYIHVVAAADIGNMTVISCNTTFDQRDESSNVSTAKEFQKLTDAPRYHHTWQSPPIRVINTTGNTRRIDQQVS